VSTRVSNSLLVGSNHLFLLFHYLASSKNHTGAIIGQVIVGFICDRIGRKAALVITTALIILRVGATLATAAHGAGGSAAGLFWFLTVARQIILSFSCV
jgi:MFS family permease